ncbi:MAG: hypothetical protein U0002_03325 [Thermoanaerobaculia bacterium]
MDVGKSDSHKPSPPPPADPPKPPVGPKMNPNAGRAGDHFEAAAGDTVFHQNDPSAAKQTVALQPAQQDGNPTPQPSNPVPKGNFVGANYTDIGRTADGPINPDSPGFRAAVEEDIKRLEGLGVTDLRVWADPPGGGMNVDQMAKRIDIIADVAAEHGMRITVDLSDGSSAKGMDNLNGTVSDQISQRLAVMDANQGHSNIDWSMGNEIGLNGNASKADMDAFATFVENQAATMRQHMGDGQHLVIELTPGALGNHPGSPGPNATTDDVLAAMHRVARAVDTVSIHFYPVAAPGQLPNQVGWIQPANDFASLKSWQAVANQEGRDFIVGEFAVPRDDYALASGKVPGLDLNNPDAVTAAKNDPNFPSVMDQIDPQQYADLTNQWLGELYGMGVRQVRFWQLTKDDPGHNDPSSLDTAAAGHGDETQKVVEMLQGSGWVGRPAPGTETEEPTPTPKI